MGMTNEAVVWVLIITIFSFSLWLSSGIYLILKRLNHIEQFLSENRRRSVKWNA